MRVTTDAVQVLGGAGLSATIRRALDARREGAADRGGHQPGAARDRRALRGPRRARTTAVALALLAAVLAGCQAGAKEPRLLPPGVDPPSFLTQSADARGTILIGTTQGVYRSVDVGASWSRTSPTVYRALWRLHLGVDIVSRGRLFQRGDLSFDHVNKPTRAPFFGGVARSLAWLPGGKLYALVENAPYRLFVSQQRPHLVAAAGLRSARRGRRSRPRGSPVTATCFRGVPRQGPVALDRRRRALGPGRRGGARGARGDHHARAARPGARGHARGALG